MELKPVMSKSQIKRIQTYPIPEHNKAGRVIQVFLNADLRYGMRGLSETCYKHGIKTLELKSGQYVVFVNRSRTMLKLITQNNVVAQLKRNNGEVIDLTIISRIPQAFLAQGTVSCDELIKQKLLDSKA